MSSYKTADSDVKMMIATQVAYLDGDEGERVGDLVDRIIKNYEGKGSLSDKDKAQLETAQYIREQLDKYNIHDCERWVIKEVDDQNQGSGFYGCLIDTLDGEAILAFRGSESYKSDEDGDQIQYDWIDADLGLLNSTGTTQQMLAAEFTKHVNDEYGDKYSNFNFTGHSLGGNLAEHAAVTAPEGMSINRCVNYDGPGFSNEYIEAHSAQIEQRNQSIDHFQYSAVGALLTPLPGTNYRTIEATDAKDKYGLEKYVWRHHTENIQFDSDGNVKDGAQDILAAAFGPISKDIDNIPPNALVPVLTTAVSIAASIPGGTIAVAGTAIAVAAGLYLKDRLDDIFESIGEGFQDLKKSLVNWYRSTFSVALTGEYEMSVSSVNAIGDSLDNSARKLNRISDEIADVAQKLRYNSLAGSYYRSKIKSLSSTVARDGTKASALADAARGCADNTVIDDNKAAEGYHENKTTAQV